MAIIYTSQLKDQTWSRWQEWHTMPPPPFEFDQDGTTFTLCSIENEEWCFAYDPAAEAITWCMWAQNAWTEWLDEIELAPPPNWMIDEEESYFSMGTRGRLTQLYSYNINDFSVYTCTWIENNFEEWKGPLHVLTPPPNLDEDSTPDIFVAGDTKSEKIISVNPDNWTLYSSSWQEDGYGEWKQAPTLSVPHEWLDVDIDLDGDFQNHQTTIFATVYDELD